MATSFPTYGSAQFAGLSGKLTGKWPMEYSLNYLHTAGGRITLWVVSGGHLLSYLDRQAMLLGKFIVAGIVGGHTWALRGALRGAQSASYP